MKYLNKFNEAKSLKCSNPECDNTLINGDKCSVCGEDIIEVNKNDNLSRKQLIELIDIIRHEVGKVGITSDEISYYYDLYVKLTLQLAEINRGYSS